MGLETIIIFVFCCIPPLVSVYLIRQEEKRHRQRIQQAMEVSINRRSLKRINRDPEEHYVDGLGYIVGDISCEYNARSPYIRCAVNPEGLCQDCIHYSPK